MKWKMLSVGSRWKMRVDNIGIGFVATRTR